MKVDAMLRSSQDRMYAYIVDLALWQYNATGGDRDRVDDILIRNLEALFDRYDRAIGGMRLGSRDHRIAVRALKAAIEATSMVVQSRARIVPFIERFEPILEESGMSPEDVAYRSYRIFPFGKGRQ